ncbi:MAG: hypothetical protein JWO82_2742 [Akkermansiaceae bacterium]|nr:hypothetical protein [Akkermansiaceae bacterium]
MATTEKELRIVLNRQAIEAIHRPVQRALAELYPAVSITVEDGHGAQEIVLDVQSLVRGDNEEVHPESRGRSEALEVERTLKARLQP